MLDGWSNINQNIIYIFQVITFFEWYRFMKKAYVCARIARALRAQAYVCARITLVLRAQAYVHAAWAYMFISMCVLCIYMCN